MSQIVDIFLPEISCVFQMFTFVTSCCSPAFPPQYKRAPVFALYGMQVGVYRMLLSECFRVLCPSTVSVNATLCVEGQKSRTNISPIPGNITISLFMNITMNQLGGASVIAIFTTRRSHGYVNTTTWLGISQFSCFWRQISIF